MTQDKNKLVMSEGILMMPEGYVDRTTNLLVPPDPQRSPNLNVIRDKLNPGEALNAYVQRQIKELKSRLTAYRLLAQGEEHLGSAELNIKGERIDGLFKNGPQMIRQRQAAFILHAEAQRVMVFSATTIMQFDDNFERLWRAWLDSYRPIESA